MIPLSSTRPCRAFGATLLLASAAAFWTPAAVHAAAPESSFQAAYAVFTRAVEGDDAAVAPAAESFGSLAAAYPGDPVLLQPLVENSIRHGLEPQVEGGRIKVRAAREGPCLVLTVCDTGRGMDAETAHPPPHAEPGGFGLLQIRERLATLHGAKASLRLTPAPQGGGTLARIELPWPADFAKGSP